MFCIPAYFAVRLLLFIILFPKGVFAVSWDSVITVAGLLLLAGAFSNKLSSRFNLPTLLLFLTAGIFAESVLPFNGYNYASQINFFGIAAMCFILFSGGSDTSVQDVKKVAFRGLLLAVIGVSITAFITGIGAYAFMGKTHSFLWCMLLGALISSTDAAAVFAILRGRGVKLKGNLAPLLELESGSNDPMAAFLTLMLIGLFGSQANSSGEIFFDALSVVYQLGVGIISGWIFGIAGRKCFKVKLEYEGLYFVSSVAIVLLCYGVTQQLGANGFMACYVCGISLNSARYNYQKALTKFHNGIAWLMQVGLFTVLGFLAEPEKLFVPDVWIPGVVLGLVLMFIARPISVFICLAGSDFSFREKIMISWVGIRGAAPIVLATFPLAADIVDAALMFRLIFFMVILSVLLQGWTLIPAAKLLKVASKAKNTPSPAPLELEVTGESAHQEMREYHISENSGLNGKTLSEIGFPPGVLVTMLRRDGRTISPGGSTVVKAGDGLLIMADRQILREVAKHYFSEQNDDC